MARPRDTTGARIRAARLAAGLQQSELAERCGMSRGQLFQLESDWRGRTPKVATVRKIAEVLGIPWHELFSEKSA